MSKRLAECYVCGKDRCLEIKKNRMFYCFRFGKTYFMRDGKVYYDFRYSDDKSHLKKKEDKSQQKFDFGSVSQWELDNGKT